MLFADYQPYVDCQARVSEAYRDQQNWTRMSILNCARVGRFSSDRSIREYCRDIWNVEPDTIGEGQRDRSRESSRVLARRSAPPVTEGRRQLQRVLEERDAVELLLFDDVEALEPSRVVPLDAGAHRTYHYWHVFVPDLVPGQIYAYRAHGPFAPERGLGSTATRCSSIPTDSPSPCPPRLRPRRGERSPATTRRRDEERGRRSVALRLGRRSAAAAAVRPDRDLRDARPRLHPASELGRDADKRGTYAGLIEKIPYSKDLGVTAVELLPVYQFDPQDAPTGR